MFSPLNIVKCVGTGPQARNLDNNVPDMRTDESIAESIAKIDAYQLCSSRGLDKCQPRNTIILFLL